MDKCETCQIYDKCDGNDCIEIRKIKDKGRGNKKNKKKIKLKIEE